MKFTVAATLAVSAFAGKTARSDAFRSRVVRQANMSYWLEDFAIPLPPDQACLRWETDTDECDEQWEAWEAYCDEKWTDMCERVDV